jgi:hypothetical protein
VAIGSEGKPKRWEGQEIKATVPVGDFPPDHLMITESRDRPAFNKVPGDIVGPVSVENDSKTLSIQRHGSVLKRTVRVEGLFEVNGRSREEQFREPSRIGQKRMDGFAS